MSYPPHPPARRFLRAAVLAALVAALPLRAQEAVPDAAPGYLAQRFTTEHGLPSADVTGLAAQPGGDLWVATFAGLARFDGQRFTVFGTMSEPPLPSNRITNVWTAPGEVWARTEASSLVRLRDGTARAWLVGPRVPWRTLVARVGGATWVASDDGVWESRGGRLVRRWPRLIRGPAWALRRAVDGAVWIGQPGALLRVRDGRRPERLALPAGAVPWDAARDAEGRLWVATDRGVFVRDGRRFQRADPAGWRDVQTLSVDAERHVWVPSAGLSYRLGAGPAPLPLAPPGSRAWLAANPSDPSSARASDGAVWQARDGWLFRDGERVLPARDGGGRTPALVADGEGNVWVGGPDGLLRVRRQALAPLGDAERLSGQNVYPLLAARDGTVWAGLWETARPLARIVGDQTTELPVGDARGGESLVTALMEDHTGTVWVGAQGLYRVRGGRTERVPGVEPPAFVNALLEDRRGRVWVGGDSGLLVGVPDGRGGFAWSRVAGPDVAVRALAETARGEVLVGTNGRGLGRVAGRGRAEWLTRADGLASDQIRDVYEDDRGVLWIATEDRGLCRLDRQGAPSLRAGRLGCVSSRDGLPSDALHRVLPDDRGRLWIGSNGGIFALDRAQADRAVLAGERVVPVAVLTEADGLRDREGNGGRQPAGSRALDGRLWFPTQDGVAVVDPSAVEPLPPPAVRIEGVDVGDASVPDSLWAAGAVRMPAGVRDLRVVYAGLAFSHPESVRYRVRLVGYEDDWREVGGGQAEAFANLPPGAYRFEVEAGRGGQWSTPATLAVVRAPHPWERPSVRLFALLLLAGCGAALVRLRERRHQRRERSLEATVAERTAELRRANDVKARFLQNVSHELRTPLTLLLGPLRDLRDGRLGPDEARPLLDRADAHGRRLERLIGDLLDLSRLDAETVALDVAPLDLAAFVRDRVSAFGSRAGDASVALTVDARPVTIAADARALETVVYNLVGNALKFTPPGGSIRICVGPDGAGAALVVSDTGPGVDPADRARLFERFYQADAPASRAGGGAGIGLALTAELVALHGGTVDVESEPGHGARFTVWLPAGDAGPADAAPRVVARAALPYAGAARDGAGDGARVPNHEAAPNDDADDAPLVLVVEDNADLRAYLRAVLAPAFQVDEAADGAAGLARAVETVPDLVLSDVMMPGVDGFALLAALKGDVRTSHVPVVLLTARADAESRLAGLAGGADDYLAKPFAAAEVEARVRNLIATRRRLRALWRRTAGPADLPVAGLPGEPRPLVDAAPLPPAEAAFLARVAETVEARMGEATFSVDALAESVGLSGRQLRRKLAALTGESPADMVRRLRLERAAALLAAGTHSVKETVYAVGFGSGAGFRRAFRDRFGVAPADYADADGPAAL